MSSRGGATLLGLGLAQAHPKLLFFLISIGRICCSAEFDPFVAAAAAVWGLREFGVNGEEKQFEKMAWRKRFF